MDSTPRISITSVEKSAPRSLQGNVIANGIGQGWRGLTSFIFIPVYIHYLGIEAYGLIGIYALLQAWLAILDMGLRPALSREMARFSAGLHDAQSIRDLLRSVELIGIPISAVVATGVWLLSGWLAVNWLHAENLPVTVVSRAIAIMGLVSGSRLTEDIYTSCLSGLELQVEQNVIVTVMATLRACGAVAVLALVSPTVQAFFLWQATVSLITVGWLARCVYTSIPAGTRNARFSRSALGSVWRFAAGMVGITLSTLFMTQIDKILLSRLLTLKEYGYYSLGAVAANALSLITMPIVAAYYPRFTALASVEAFESTRTAYHQSAQLISVLMGSAAIMLITFRVQVMTLWTGDESLVAKAATLMAVLVLGRFLNGLMAAPYQMMLAHGWTDLTIKTNLTAALVFAPAAFLTVGRYGAIGAAWALAVLYAAYAIVTISLMHRRILVGERWRWLKYDVIFPVAGASITAILCRSLIPHSHAKLALASEVLLVGTCVVLASALCASQVRHLLIDRALMVRSHFFRSSIALSD